MTKYVVGHSDMVLAITTNRADAEEFILSRVEEDAYADYIYDWDSYEPYIERWKRAYSSSYYKCLTLWGYMLMIYGCDYWISEVEEI